MGLDSYKYRICRHFAGVGSHILQRFVETLEYYTLPAAGHGWVEINLPLLLGNLANSVRNNHKHHSIPATDACFVVTSGPISGLNLHNTSDIPATTSINIVPNFSHNNELATCPDSKYIFSINTK